jgi:acetyltransferase-like isoleucine patch superfamily enzyme
MNSQFLARFPLWSHRLESVARVVAGNIPLTVGIVLRRWIYRGLFKRFGTQITIYRGVEFVGANQIELGDYVRLEPKVRLNCSGHNIQLGSGMGFEQDVELTREKKNSLIVIGDRTSIGSHCCISGTGSIHIGNNCLIAPNVGIFSSHHTFMDSSRTITNHGNTLESIIIEDDCWIGSGAKILAGVTLGQGCVIEAGAVVTQNVPSYSVAAGVPAQVVTQCRNTLSSRQSLRK